MSSYIEVKSSTTPGVRTKSLIRSGGNNLISSASFASYLSSKPVIVSVTTAVALIIGLSVGLSGKPHTKSVITNNSSGPINRNLFFPDPTHAVFNTHFY